LVISAGHDTEPFPGSAGDQQWSSRRSGAEYAAPAMPSGAGSPADEFINDRDVIGTPQGRRRPGL